MALERDELKQLMLATAKADKSAPVAFSYGENKYSYTDLNETVREELKELAGNFNLYRRNQLTIFELMQEVVDDILPKKVLDAYGMFAEIRTFAQGDKPTFVVKKGKKRAKQFITRVGLAGIYEVFKLDKGMFDVTTEAFGGAAQIGLEEFLDGLADFNEMLDIILEGLDDVVYREIARSLATLGANLPGANVESAAGFDETKMDKLIGIASCYGDPVIYATLELARKIVPQSGWISEAHKNEMWSQGYIGVYKGTRVITLPQSYEDETNTTKVIDPSFAYIIPSGGNDKPVKIAFEGQAIVDEYKNTDRSREIQIYKKLGVSLLATNNLCLFEDTSL